MIGKLQQNILNGEFELGRQLYDRIDYETLKHDIHIIAYDLNDISVYFFIADMIFHKEDAELHYIAASLLINPFVYIQGAYYMAYNHLREATTLEPSNVKYMENLLLFYHIPDKILKRKEAIKIAKSIMSACPDSKAAKSIIKECC